MPECPICETWVDPVRDLRLRKDGFDLVRCRQCLLLMRASLPEPSELAAIYAPGYFRHETGEPIDGYADYLADATRHRSAARRRLALLARFRPDRGRLLDVGAAAGFFVAEAKRAGWAAEGIDVAEPMVRWGVSTLDVRLQRGSLHSLDESLGENQFSAVTMWDYIEHSLDPAGEIDKCRQLLGPGGVLAISTGDIDSFAARASRSRWHLLTPHHHNFFFSSSTLTRLVEHRGFEVLWIRHPGSRYSVAHLAYKFDRTLRVRMTNRIAARLASSRFGRIGVPFNLYDIVTMIARVPV